MIDLMRKKGSGGQNRAGRKKLKKPASFGLEDDQILMFLTTRPKPRWANRRAFPEVRPKQRAK
jgi:hypothetical protein